MADIIPAADARLILIALAGTGLGSLIGLCPGLHIYTLCAWLMGRTALLGLDDAAASFASLGMLAGWLLGSIVPLVFLHAPDDSGSAGVLPATALVLQGRGPQAALWIGAGSLGAICALAALAPLLDLAVRPLRQILQPHTGWMLVAVIAFLLLGEWPRADELQPTALRRIASAWGWLGAGLLTFGLSGLLGLTQMFDDSGGPHALLPVFAGLFGVPGLIQVLSGRDTPVPQRHTPLGLGAGALLTSTLTGLAGGLFALFVPALSGGIGGLLAGHATAQREERAFLVAQGASRAAYVTGGALLLFLPGVSTGHGGLGALLSVTFVPHGWRLFWLALAALALGSALGMLVLRLCLRGLVAFSSRAWQRPAAAAALAVTLLVAALLTGGPGFLILGVATPIGLIPVFVGSRRLNCLGVLLLPVALGQIGLALPIAHALGLV